MSIFTALLLCLTVSCGGGSSTTTQPEPDPPVNPDPITSITASQLLNGFDYLSPAEESVFAMPTNAVAPTYNFEGRLELTNESSVGDIVYHSGNQIEGLEHLPSFNFEFIQDGTFFIPKHRGAFITDHPIWNYIIEPGRAWQQADDGDYSRVSFPFSLVPKGGNSVYSGTMLLLFNDNGISKVWYQITQETTVSATIDMWGLVDAVYHPQSVEGSTELISAYFEERENHFPTKPITALATDYPGVVASQFGRGLTAANRTLYGLVVNGVNYTSTCHTRYGDYYYCDQMRFPSYSTAKSAFAGVALMRMSQTFDANAQNLLVKDFVAETADATGNWDRVTFGNILDMATGNYQSSQFMVDEEQFATHPFFTETFYAERIAAAFTWPSSAAPGTQWVYHTSDTFIAIRTMQNYLQLQLGEESDLFDYVVDQVYKPIKMAPGVFSTARTEDNNWQGQAFGGSGLWWNSDDIAKITNLLNVDDGAYHQQQLLDPELLRATMQLDPGDRGVTINAQEKYNNGFWATRYGTANGFSCEFWVTEMQGFSGIVVVMMPNGSSYYYASDNREFTWLDAVRESNKIAPHCQ